MTAPPSRGPANPSFQLVKQGDLSATQVGVNLFSAAVASRYGDLSLPQPFEIYGRPDLPTALLKTFGDGNSAMVNTPAGTVKVKVVDQHGNPLSNIPVTFTAQAAVSQGSLSLPAGTRNIEFYRKEDCSIAFPLPGDCGTVSAFTQVSAHHGAGIETLLGNTLNTRYTIAATAPGLPAVAFSLYSLGDMDAGAYAAQLFIEQLITVNEQGVAVNAAKAGETLATPLSAALFMLSNDYSLEKYSCTKNDAAGHPYPGDCWRLIGSSLINSKRITDGTVRFTPTQGGGRVGPVKNTGGGIYQAPYTTGPQPALNRIVAIGEATVIVPEVVMDADGRTVQDGYTTATLPLRTVTVQTGQKLLFDRSSKELGPNPTPNKVTYENYGVQVPTTVSPVLVLLGDGGQAQENVTVGYTIQPPGEAPAGYQSLSAQVDLFDGSGTWVGYLVGDATQGTGTAVFSYGTVFDPAKQYYAQAVLNRGSAIEIRGDKVQVQTLAVDLDLDSDNNAGTLADGTHKDPSRNPLEEQVEDLIGFPGKVISPNLKDVDNDKIPGFADGIDLYGNSGTHASAPFTPLLFELAGSVLDPAQATVRFAYPGSNPALVQKATVEGKDLYTPAPGSLRLWSKDGPESRKVADLSAGGDYLTPGASYTLSQLGSKQPDGSWKFYAEGIVPGLTPGDQRIVIQIDPDGDGPLPCIEADAVRSSVILAALVPDYNHNREIDAEDKERAQRGDAYYFWINDDDDSGETGGDDIPKEETIYTTSRDCDDNQVDGVRDLIDFFPVVFDVKQLLDLFPPPDYFYKLKTAEHNLNVIPSDLDQSTATSYLTNVETARRVAQDAVVYPVSAAGDFSGSRLDSKAGQQAFQQMLQRIRDNETPGILLVEGHAAGTAPLVLEVADPAGKQVFTTSLNLSLDGVEQMFRHVNLVPTINNSNAPAIETGQIGENKAEGGEVSRYDRDDFANKDHFSGFDVEFSDRYLVLLHGANVDGQQARGFHSEIFKRLYWSGSKAKFVGVSWYGAEGTNANYQPNVVNAFKTAEQFGEKIALATHNAPVTLMAHSLGNMVLSSYLNDHYQQHPLNVTNYFLVNAAVALEAYLGDYQGYAEGKLDDPTTPKIFGIGNPMVHSDWYGYDKRLGTSEWHQLFGPSDPRRTLTWRHRFANLPESINYYSFYSTGEDVLATYAGESADFQFSSPINSLARYSWVLQEKWKGLNLPLGSTNLMGWGFNFDHYQATEEVAAGSLDAHPWPSATANSQILNEQLVTQPFFRKPSVGQLGCPLFDSTVIAAYVNDIRDELLALALPSLTLVTGGELGGDMNYGDFIIKEKLFDMNAEKNRNGWPANRENNNWLHSDIKDVSYVFDKNIFDSIVNNGGLK